jgi:phospholipid/cholesterol/gamma-HCH transport system ATP-binding protein
MITQNVNFSIKYGEIFLVIGASGCGKSTLLKHLIGLKKYSPNTIFDDEVDVFEYQDRFFTNLEFCTKV